MKKGFTLIEMLVASSLLVMVVMGMMTIFSSMVKSQNMVLDSQYLLDQGSYVMEYMGRALRMAKKSTGACIAEGKNYQSYSGGVKFVSSDNKCRAFFLDDETLYNYKDGEVTALTPSNVSVTNFDITIVDGEAVQPFVKIVLEIESSEESRFSGIELETTISQRDLNFPN